MTGIEAWAVICGTVLGTVLVTQCAGCGASVQEVQAATYAAAEGVCGTQATSYDAGLECARGVKAVFCGPGGAFADAGLSACEGGM